MLQFTRALHTLFQNPNLPRVLNRITPSRLELTLILLKERKKKVRYLGSTLMHTSDRNIIYSGRGGVRKGTKFIVEQHHSRAQYCHPGHHSDRVDIRTVRLAGSQYDQLGNFTRMTWDCSLASTNVFQDPSFHRQLRGIHHQEAINMLEEWGVRYVLLDEIRKPSVTNCKYFQHQLYANKFSWSPDPITNAHVGDVEFKWKQNEQISYHDYGAYADNAKNAFRSLWKPKVAGDAKVPTAAA